MHEAHSDQLYFDLPGGASEERRPGVGSASLTDPQGKHKSEKLVSDAVGSSAGGSEIEDVSRADLASRSDRKDDSTGSAVGLVEDAGRRIAAAVSIEASAESLVREESAPASGPKETQNVDVGICSDVAESKKVGGESESDRLTINTLAPEHGVVSGGGLGNSTVGVDLEQPGKTPESTELMPKAMAPEHDGISPESTAPEQTLTETSASAPESGLMQQTATVLDCSSMSVCEDCPSGVTFQKDKSESAPEPEDPASDACVPEPQYEAEAMAPESDVASHSAMTAEPDQMVDPTEPASDATTKSKSRSSKQKSKAKRTPKRQEINASGARKRIKHQTGLDAIKGCRFDLSIERTDADILRAIAEERRISYRVLLREIVHGWASAVSQSTPGHDAQAQNQNV